MSFLFGPPLWLPPKPAIIRPWKREEFKPLPLVQASFLPGWMPGAAAVPNIITPELSFTASAGSATDASSYTFSSLSFGAADTFRHILVGTIARDDGTADFTPSTVTIGGVAASEINHIGTNTGGSNSRHVISLWRAKVPTGTTGSVIVDWGQTVTRCAVMVFRLIHATGAPYDNQEGSGTSNTASTPSITMPPNGVGMAVGYMWELGAGTPTATWSGTANPSEQVDATVETVSGYSGALLSNTGVVTLSSAAGDHIGIEAATWGPASP